jgi:hypothetical protein
MDIGNCFHCGNEIIKKEEIIFDEKVSVVTVVRRFMKFLVKMI